MVDGRKEAPYQDDDSERTGGHQPVNPVLDLVQRHVEAGGHHTALVDAAVELDHDLAGTVVVDVFKLINVAVFLHHGQETDDHFGAGSDQHLAFSTPFGIEYVV